MATKKAGGSAKNQRDSGPQYLGTKLYDGEKASVGAIIVRQRGTVILAGENVGIGKDHTLFALKEGVVNFTSKRKLNFNGKMSRKSVANVTAA